MLNARDRLNRRSALASYLAHHKPHPKNPGLTEAPSELSQANSNARAGAPVCPSGFFHAPSPPRCPQNPATTESPPQTTPKNVGFPCIPTPPSRSTFVNHAWPRKIFVHSPQPLTPIPNGNPDLTPATLIPQCPSPALPPPAPPNNKSPQQPTPPLPPFWVRFAKRTSMFRSTTSTEIGFESQNPCWTTYPRCPNP